MTTAPDEHQTLMALVGTLRAAYLDQLPAARAAILGRLWGALAREPLTGIHHRTVERDTLRIHLDDGRTLTGPFAATTPFAAPPATLTLHNQPGLALHHQPGALDGPAYDGPGPSTGATRTRPGPSTGDRPDPGTRTPESRDHDQPGALLRALGLPGETARYAVELDNSVANLALARAAARQPAMDTLVAAEQSVVDGHPLHPACRARIGMSTADVLRYAPEHHPVVRLHLVDIDPARWTVSGVPRPPVLPVHPWQLERVLAAGAGRDTGRTVAADPLMSLRTLAPHGDPGVHLKTAMDVQMTSAVRTLSPAAVRNGPLMSALLADLAVPGLTVLREISAAAVLDGDGEPDRHMAAVWREAPRPGTVLPLAALAAFPALLTPPFLDALVDLLLPPLLTLLGLGVGLEAHGQNTLVRLHGTRPAEVLYRDMGGVRVHSGRLARAGAAMPPLIGAIPADDAAQLRTTLAAALFGTVLPHLVAAAPDVDPGTFWPRTADRVHRLLKDRPDDRAALLDGPVPVKATTAMRLAADPLDDVWAYLPNPMAS